MTAFKRNVFSRINKFQWRIIFYLSALGACCLSLMLLFLSYLYTDIDHFIHTRPFVMVRTCIVIALPLSAFLVLIVCLYTYYMTNKMFGPYDRIVGDLKKMNDEGEKRQLTVRQEDEMFRELVVQLNRLIRRS